MLKFQNLYDCEENRWLRVFFFVCWKFIWREDRYTNWNELRNTRDGHILYNVPCSQFMRVECSLWVRPGLSRIDESWPLPLMDLTRLNYRPRRRPSVRRRRYIAKRGPRGPVYTDGPFESNEPGGPTHSLSGHTRPLPIIAPRVGNFVSIYRPAAEKASPTATTGLQGDVRTSVGQRGGGDNETVEFIAGDFLEKNVYGDLQSLVRGFRKNGHFDRLPI